MSLTRPNLPFDIHSPNIALYVTHRVPEQHVPSSDKSIIRWLLILHGESYWCKPAVNATMIDLLHSGAHSLEDCKPRLPGWVLRWVPEASVHRQLSDQLGGLLVNHPPRLASAKTQHGNHIRSTGIVEMCFLPLLNISVASSSIRQLGMSSWSTAAEIKIHIRSGSSMNAI